MIPLAVAFAVGGAAWGLVADRLSSRWPEHEDAVRRGLDWRTVALVVGGAVAMGALPLRWTEPRDLAVLAAWFVVLLVLVATDLDQKLLPDLLTLPLIPITLVLVLSGWDPILAGKDLALLSAVVAGLATPALLVGSSAVLGGGLGAGDVKLAVSLGLMCGIVQLISGFLVASIGAALILVVLLATHRIGLKTAIPFGPILLVAGMCAALVG
ncbi:MAG: prepilin peptidase [Candidatus Limnocylindrales bacterium]